MLVQVNKLIEEAIHVLKLVLPLFPSYFDLRFIDINGPGLTFRVLLVLGLAVSWYLKEESREELLSSSC